MVGPFDCQYLLVGLDALVPSRAPYIYPTVSMDCHPVSAGCSYPYLTVSVGYLSLSGCYIWRDLQVSVGYLSVSRGSVGLYLPLYVGNLSSSGVYKSPDSYLLDLYSISLCSAQCRDGW